MANSAFEISDEMREEACKKAAKVRMERTEIKKAVTEGKISLDEIVAKKDDPVYGKIRVKQLLMAYPNIGKARAEKIMTEIGIAEGRRVAGLGDRQIKELKERLN